MATQSPSRSTSDEPLSVRVVREIAAYEGVDPMNLSPPLHYALDLPALDSLFDSTATGGPRTGHVTFTYDGKTVTVDSDGAVTIDADHRSEQLSQ